MAFVTSVPSCSALPVRTTSTCSAQPTRRSVLRFAALSLLSTHLVQRALAQDIDLKELEKTADVESIKYEDELLDVGPDPVERNILRAKKKEPEPEYKKDEKQLVESSEQKYDAMVADEIAEGEKIKKVFTSKK